MQPLDFPEGESHFLLAGPAGDVDMWTLTPQAAETATQAKRSAVGIVCHPHSLHGGSMQNKVVHTVATAFSRMGMKVVRFNFRSVGKSQGEYAEGEGEMDDLRAVVDWVKAVLPSHDIWLAGFSFGAYVSIRVAQSGGFAQLVSIAPPVGRFDFSDVVRPPCPWLVVQGDADEIVEADKVFAWCEQMPEPPAVWRMPGASHFFHQRLIELRDGLIARLR